MLKKKIEDLKTGDLVFDKKFSILGEVKWGPWLNIGITDRKSGDGPYIEWDDGDRSCVGFELMGPEDLIDVLEDSDSYT